MKKLIAIILSIILLTPSLALADTRKVAGFKEKMDALFMKNVLSREQINNLDQKRTERSTDAFWSAEAHMIEQMGEWLSETHDLDEELQYYLAQFKPDFESGILVSELSTLRFANQYAKEGHFDYLFSGLNYWAAPTPYLELRADYQKMVKKNNPRYMIRVHFNYDGISVHNTMFSENGEDIAPNPFVNRLDKGVFSFLKDYGRIEQQLLDKGETSVSQIKVCMWTNNLSFLCLKCEDREYLIRIRDASEDGNDESPEIQSKLTLFKLYTAEEVTDVISSIPGLHPVSSHRELADVVPAIKPTFSVEAVSLKNDGLLSGTEKGLDLLKPLTRIEATAMIVRAMGETEIAPNRNARTFSDVPPTHWGYGAAEKAYSLNITKGVGDGKFAPDRFVSANEFSTMILNAADTENFDWQWALEILTEKGIITSQNAETMDFFTRGDMAKIIYEARRKGFL